MSGDRDKCISALEQYYNDRNIKRFLSNNEILETIRKCGNDMRCLVQELGPIRAYILIHILTYASMFEECSELFN